MPPSQQSPQNEMEVTIKIAAAISARIGCVFVMFQVGKQRNNGFLAVTCRFGQIPENLGHRDRRLTSEPNVLAAVPHLEAVLRIWMAVYSHPDFRSGAEKTPESSYVYVHT